MNPKLILRMIVEVISHESFQEKQEFKLFEHEERKTLLRNGFFYGEDDAKLHFYVFLVKLFIIYLKAHSFLLN